MTDQEREASIADLGMLMTSVYEFYEHTGRASAKAQADGYRVAMERLISQRSTEQVARMETERGLVSGTH